jgi:ribonuclease P/MRP protein subunit RPP40
MPPRRSGSLDQWASQAGILDPVISIVTCEKTHLENVWVPNPTSLPPRRQAKQEEEYEDWEHEVSVLFEWVGMAGFHAQRSVCHRLNVREKTDCFRQASSQ